MTAAVGDPSDTDGPVHVFVNPDVTDGLRRAGAQVVMSHELVHVATDAVRRPVEPWLLEGFADYVALRDTRLPDRVTLGRAIEAARRDGVPDRLPTAADFDTRARDLQARYEEAWLACRIIAERLGEQGLVSVYRRAGDGSPPCDRHLSGAGLPQTALDRAVWRARSVSSLREAMNATEGDRTAGRLERTRVAHSLALVTSVEIRGRRTSRPGSRKRSATDSPKAVTATMMATAMQPTMRPYSTAVAPARPARTRVASCAGLLRMRHRKRTGPARRPKAGAGPVRGERVAGERAVPTISAPTP